MPRLLQAYSQGIFPWYSEGEPILWWSPDPRFVLYPKQLHVPKSLRQSMRKSRFEVSLDQDFEAVIAACAQLSRPGQEGTWITEEMRQGYIQLHRAGYAHSVEVWEQGKLAGGLYGVSLGRCFFGESMFSRVSDASKTGLVTLAQLLQDRDFDMIDSQVYTQHMERFGAIHISRKRYLAALKASLRFPSLKGSWEKWIN